MEKYFFKVSYNGKGYHGWQRQNNVLGVQEVIETVLSKAFKKQVKIVGCGRTDAGVHAQQYFFHVFLPDIKPEFIFKINKSLPAQIAVKDLFLVEKGQHAQKDATLRIYTYYFHLQKDPYLESFSTWYPLKLDLKQMQKAATLISKATDFHQFCLSPQKHSSTICTIKEVEIKLADNKLQYAIRFSGDHFLKSMVRLLVGEILEVGLGKTSLQELEGYLNRSLTKPKHHKAFPQGLHLTTVLYPYVKSQAEELLWLL